MSDKKCYVVLRRSGAVMPLGSGMGEGVSSGGPYLAILDKIATEYQSAGGDYDRPHQLLLNGEVVVPGGLADLAWNYQQDKIAAREAATREVRNLHSPKWLPSDEGPPGYNPPGCDKWTVRKAKP